MTANAPPRRLRVAVAFAAVLAITATGCSGGGGDDDARATITTTAAATSTTTVPAPELEVLPAGDASFYDVPDPLPAGDNGDLLRVQPLPGAPDGTTWQRIMYLSETVAGAPTVVTGVVTLPTAAPPAGGWPLFSHAHGSTGMADACAPSVSIAGDKTYAAELMLLANHVKDRDVAVVSTDYEGLGGPGVHPFLVGESEGRGVLDAIRAARQLPGVEFQDPVGIIGYSQGGHAAAWANQIAPTYAPELDIAGVLAGAPATEVDEMVAGDEFAAFLLLGALAATGDEFDPATVLTDAGLAALDQLDAVCQDVYDVGDTLLTADVTTTEPWASAIAATVPGAEPGAAPVLIVHSTADENVPIAGSEAFQARLCAAGQVVERRVLPEGSHVLAAIPAYEQGIEWITGLMAGAQPTSTCP